MNVPIRREAKVETSQARLKEAEAKKKKAEVDIGAAKADRDRLSALLSYTRITAPYDGVVTRRNINTDDFVQPPTGGKGEPLYVVERRDKMRIVVEVPEADASWVAKNAPARIRVQALGWQEFSGQVARTSYSISRSARTLVAEIDLVNRQDRLRPGMYVVATITGEHAAALALPVSAVATQGDVTQGYQRYCYVVRDGKAERTLVQVGLGDGNFVEVLRKQASQQRVQILNDRVQVKDLRHQFLPPAEGKEPLREQGGPLARVDDRAEILFDRFVALRAQHQ